MNNVANSLVQDLAIGGNRAPSPLLDAAINPIFDEDHDHSKREFISKGEKIHKWGTYLGVDWLFNAFTGVSFAYWGKFTKTGQKVWSGPIQKGFEKVLKPFIKEEAQLARSAGYGGIFISIIAGGMFTIPPLMILENNKVKKSIVTSLDNKLHGKDVVENDPKFQQAHEEIANAPKKDFTSGLTSRFAALAPLLAIVIIPVTKKFGNKVWFNHVENASEFTAKKLGFSAEKSFKSLPPAEAQARWKFIHESIAMDFGLGVPYAIMHELFYTKFAATKDKAANAIKKIAKNDSEAAPQTEAPSPAANVSPAQPEVVLATEGNPKKFTDLAADQGTKNIVKSDSFTDKIRAGTEAASAAHTVG